MTDTSYLNGDRAPQIPGAEPLTVGRITFSSPLGKGAVSVGERITLTGGNWPASENVSGKVWLLQGTRLHECWVPLGIFTSASAADSEKERRETSGEDYDVYEIAEWDLNQPAPLLIYPPWKDDAE